jgi:hypothetical protein
MSLALVTHRRPASVQVNFLLQTAKPVDATVFENEFRSNHQVANCSRYTGFTGTGCCCDPRSDVHGDAANLAGLQVNLTSMDATTQCYTERRDCVGDCRGASNCTRWAIKDADKAVSTVSDFLATKSPELISRRTVMPIE